MGTSPMPSAAYENAIGGKLKLGGKALDTVDGAIKKKKKKKDKKSKKDKDDSAHMAQAPSREQPTYEKELTKAQLKHREHFKNVTEELHIRKAVNLNHRQKVARLNHMLETMPEHYDIPRVGPG